MHMTSSGKNALFTIRLVLQARSRYPQAASYSSATIAPDRAPNFDFSTSTTSTANASAESTNTAKDSPSAFLEDDVDEYETVSASLPPRDPTFKEIPWPTLFSEKTQWPWQSKSTEEESEHEDGKLEAWDGKPAWMSQEGTGQTSRQETVPQPDIDPTASPALCAALHRRVLRGDHQAATEMMREFQQAQIPILPQVAYFQAAETCLYANPPDRDGFLAWLALIPPGHRYPVETLFTHLKVRHLHEHDFNRRICLVLAENGHLGLAYKQFSDNLAQQMKAGESMTILVKMLRAHHAAGLREEAATNTSKERIGKGDGVTGGWRKEDDGVMQLIWNSFVKRLCLYGSVDDARKLVARFRLSGRVVYWQRSTMVLLKAGKEHKLPPIASKEFEHLPLPARLRLALCGRIRPRHLCKVLLDLEAVQATHPTVYERFRSRFQRFRREFHDEAEREDSEIADAATDGSPLQLREGWSQQQARIVFLMAEMMAASSRADYSKTVDIYRKNFIWRGMPLHPVLHEPFTPNPDLTLLSPKTVVNNLVVRALLNMLPQNVDNYARKRYFEFFHEQYLLAAQNFPEALRPDTHSHAIFINYAMHHTPWITVPFAIRRIKEFGYRPGPGVYEKIAMYQAKSKNPSQVFRVLSAMESWTGRQRGKVYMGDLPRGRPSEDFYAQIEAVLEDQARKADEEAREADEAARRIKEEAMERRRLKLERARVARQPKIEEKARKRLEEAVERRRRKLVTMRRKMEAVTESRRQKKARLLERRARRRAEEGDTRDAAAGTLSAPPRWQRGRRTRRRAEAAGIEPTSDEVDEALTTLYSPRSQSMRKGQTTEGNDEPSWNEVDEADEDSSATLHSRASQSTSQGQTTEWNDELSSDEVDEADGDAPVLRKPKYLRDEADGDAPSLWIPDAWRLDGFVNVQRPIQYWHSYKSPDTHWSGVKLIKKPDGPYALLPEDKLREMAEMRKLRAQQEEEDATGWLDLVPKAKPNEVLVKNPEEAYWQSRWGSLGKYATRLEVPGTKKRPIWTSDGVSWWDDLDPRAWESVEAEKLAGPAWLEECAARARPVDWPSWDELTHDVESWDDPEWADRYSARKGEVEGEEEMLDDVWNEPLDVGRDVRTRKLDRMVVSDIIEGHEHD